MKRAPPSGAVGRARELRREATEFERTLWRALTEAMPQYRWRRQVPIGHYIADFASHRCRLVIELDGEQHAFAAEQDAQHTRFIESEGYRVMRFWNGEVRRNLVGVLATILSAGSEEH